MKIFLDTGVLSLVTHPSGKATARDCARWLQAMSDAGHEIFVPEISDYELRRELTRARKLRSVARLDRLHSEVHYLPISTDAMRKAAEYSAFLRNSGQPGASDDDLDADMIICGQVSVCSSDLDDCVVVTNNARHFSALVNAMAWHEIQP